MITRRRCLLVWGLMSVAAGVVARWAAGAVGPTATVAELTTSVAGVALLVCTVWGWLAATAVVVEALRHPASPSRSTRGVPPWVSRLVLSACGAMVCVAPAGPALASYDVQPEPRIEAEHAAASVDGLPFPDRAVGSAGAARAPGADRPTPVRGPVATGAVVVRAGDSLWRIAEDLLRVDADAAEVAAATRALHALNRAEIGPDPDLIHPGLRLRTPGS